jgi:hypothetical protein
MRHILSVAALLLLSTFIFCSCLNSNDETDYSGECSITAFKLGSVYRTIHVTTSAGKDSTYLSSYTGTYFKMNIDQVNRRIFNNDSLLYESDLSHILATISASSTVTYRTDDPDSTNWTQYSSTDSIDFRNPLVFRVYAADGVSYKDYSVKVNVHKQASEVFSWTELSHSVAVLSAMSGTKAVAFNDSVMVFGHAGGKLTMALSGFSNGKTWSAQTLTGCDDADPTTLQKMGKTLYMTSDGGQLYASTDGMAWRAVGSAGAGRLVAASSARLYAMKNGSIVSSTDGLTWTSEVLDDDASLLPSRDYASVSYTLLTNSNFEKIFLIGNRDASAYASDTASVVWAKIEDLSDATNNDWAYYNQALDNHNMCPRLEKLQLCRYDGGLLAFGGKGLSSRGEKSLDAFYKSADNGITWVKDTAMVAPSTLMGGTAEITSAVDATNCVWIVSGGDVWKGRLNRLGFASNPTAFTVRKK